MFDRHYSQISEIFWEELKETMDRREHLLTSCMKISFIGSRAVLFKELVEKKSQELKNSAELIYETVIGIEMPRNGIMEQLVGYNWQNRKRAFKYQTVTDPDGVVLYLYEPMEGRSHD